MSDPYQTISPESFRRGQPIVPGVAFGRCQLLAGDEALLSAPLTRAADRDRELARLQRAFADAMQSLENSSSVIKDFIAEADDGIFMMCAAVLKDKTLHKRLEGYIADGYTVEAALSLTYQDYAKDYGEIESSYLRERLKDVEDVLLRLLNSSRNLERNGVSMNPEPAVPSEADSSVQSIILVAKELFASQLIEAPLRQVSGIVCQSAGTTSHATILARALRIPMMTALPEIQTQLTPRDTVLLDCQSGLCFQNPSQVLLQQYSQPLEATRRNRQHPGKEEEEEVTVDDAPTTRDGTAIHLGGNITLFSEMPLLRASGIRQVGLYRTEFMFMIRSSMPDEETQFRILKRLVDDANGSQVVVRTLDIGGDKPLPYIRMSGEANPSLGRRGLRFLLAEENLDFTLTHLRAILRVAATSPNVSIMFPMVADLHDLRQAKALLAQAARSLTLSGVAAGTPRLGIMVELPSAAMLLSQLLPECDFISIGTNDLVQYLFGVDRCNSQVAQWYRQCHPAVFRVLGLICQDASEFPGKEVSICGELAGNARALPALLGAGLRHLSMNPVNIQPARDYIRRVTMEECQELFNNVCRCATAQEAHALLDGFGKLHAL